MTANAAIFYHPEGYTTDGPKLMGRNVAGDSFLRGWLQHAQAGEFWAQVSDRQHALHFAERVRAAGRQEPVRVIQATSMGALSQPGLLYLSGPGLGESAWQRRLFGDASWSLCGLTHTTSSAQAMEALTGMLRAPVQPWDALICTSSAVRSMVINTLEAEEESLRERLSASRFVRPMLPVIPLGVHTDEFQWDAAARQSARQSLGIPPDAVAVAFVGRLSFHAKASPIAMLQGLQTAAERTRQEIWLLECGVHHNESIADAFREAQAVLAPGIRCVHLPGRQPGSLGLTWAAADIFCSLSDNIQESFGITPLEAMASGLPVVVSDWDGYRDTVRDGVDGFRVPTCMPAPGADPELARGHALGIDTYDRYIGRASLMTSVDPAATAEAFVRLIESPSLRREMGEAGKRRARELYDWRVLIPQMQALWLEQQACRESSEQAARLPGIWPSRLDPFQAYEGYPTAALGLDSLLTVPESLRPTALDRYQAYRALKVVAWAPDLLPTEAQFQVILQACGQGPVAARVLLESAAHASPGAPVLGLQGLAVLLKLGLLQRSA